MAIHDAYARITPAELSFPDQEAEERRYRAIAGEAESREVDPADPSAFVMLMEVGRALREHRGARGDPERVREHGMLLYHLFHSWRAASPTRLLDTRVVRLLLESEPWEAEGPAPSAPAGYVQLPQHLLWVRTDEGSPESVDGLFWTVGGDAVSFLVVMGIRPDRPGFGVVPLDPVPLDGLGEWIGTSMREEGKDFTSSMPGSELERLYEVRTAGEVLKLAARVLRYLSTAPPSARTEVEPAADGPGPDMRPGVDAGATAEGRRAPPPTSPGPGPRPSARPWIRVTLPA